MDLRQLQGFHAVMESRSVSRAASVLGISQPAVSALIVRLEKQLGITLFSREKRRLVPTAEANLLHSQVSEALAALGKIANAVHEIRQARTGTLSIAAHPTSSISWLPPFLAAFQLKRPGITVRLVTRSSELLRVLPEPFDIGIAEPPVHVPNVDTYRLRFRCVAALPPDHPLCKERVITPRLLDGVPFIALARWQTIHHEVNRTFDRAGARWNVVHECEFFSTAISLVAGGLGVSLIEPVSAKEEAALGRIVVREFSPAVRYDVLMFHPQRRPLAILTDEFVEEFKTYIGRFVDGR